ncbi:MAG TPA: DUF2510 domain-containing protein [Ilumatobacter sp.]|nr:DUF2510 domain-containing protein [Ilumatobacter sp.]
MRIQDAPPPGWYPDPEGTSRLRYWEGTDWSDRFRARPTDGQLSIMTQVAEAAAHREGAHRWVPDDHGLGNPSVDTQAVVDQVRLAARAEAERAAQMFGHQARSMTRDLQPLITEYTSKITRWFRIASVFAIVLLLAWVLWQFFVQVSLFEWIGDRIDNLTDDSPREPVQGLIVSRFW